MHVLSFNDLKSEKCASLVIKYYTGWDFRGNRCKTIPVEKCSNFKIVKIEDDEIFIELYKEDNFSHGCGVTVAIKDYIINKDGRIGYIYNNEKFYHAFNTPIWIILFKGEFDIDEVPDVPKQSKLHTYVYFNDYDRFVNNYTDANVKDESGKTIFELSLYNKDTKISEYLLQRIQLTINHLYQALYLENDKMTLSIFDQIEWLGVDKKDYLKILNLCFRKFNIKLMELLIKKAESLNINDLLEDDALIRQSVDFDYLHWEESDDPLQLIRLECLLKHGMKINNLSSLINQSIINYGVMYNSKNSRSSIVYKAIKLIFHYNSCDVNKPLDEDGHTNLHIVYKLLSDPKNSKYKEQLQNIIDLLQDNEANPYKNNKDGIKPINYIQNECSICLEINCREVTTKCNHYFHKLCLTKWLEDNDKCPVCRAIIKE